MIKRPKAFWFAFFLVILVSSICFGAPASVYVEILDPAYRDLERLVAWRLCDPPILDQRPFLRGEFARMTAEAMLNLKKEKDKLLSLDLDFDSFAKRLSIFNYRERVVDRLGRRFADELADLAVAGGSVPLARGMVIDEMRVDATYLSEQPLALPYDNGVGTISAKVNPLWDYREGRHAVFNYQSALETSHRLRLTKYFAAGARFRVEGNIWKTPYGADDIEPIFQEGVGVLELGDFALDFGRESVVWGPGERGALILTNNARPLDQMKISTPSPFRLPWVFRHLGKFRIGLFGANMGPNYPVKYAWLTGYRLSYMPVQYLELAFGSATLMGGEGSPHMSAYDVFAEFWGFRVAGTSGAAVNMTDHIMEASALVRIPQLAGLSLYGVLANEDKRDTFKRFFRDGSSYVAGFYLPSLDSHGKSDFRFEFKRTCAIQYRHGLYSDGFTLDSLLIGDDLGPDALGIHSRYSFELGDGYSIAANFDWEKRRSDIHTTTTDPDGTLGDIIIVEGRPADTRFRFVLEPSIRLAKALNAIIYAGYERAINANFVSGASCNNWLLAISLRFNFDDYFHFQTKS